MFAIAPPVHTREFLCCPLRENRHQTHGATRRPQPTAAEGRAAAAGLPAGLPEGEPFLKFEFLKTRCFLMIFNFESIHLLYRAAAASAY